MHGYGSIKIQYFRFTWKKYWKMHSAFATSPAVFLKLVGKYNWLIASLNYDKSKLGTVFLAFNFWKMNTK